MIDTSVPVLVLRSTYHGGLAIVRSLGRLGVPVYVSDPNINTPAFQSRYCRGRFLWDSDTGSGDALVRLAMIGSKLGNRAILIPTTDVSANLIDKCSNDLKRHFRMFDCPSGLSLQLSNKKQMYELAQQHGIPVPTTFFPNCRRELLECASAIRYPAILKPIMSAIGAAQKQPKTLVNSRMELIIAYDRMETPEQPNIMLQEFIPGGDSATWMFNGYFDSESRCIFGMTGKKLRQHRPYAGITSLGVCAQNRQTHELAVEFMSRVGYRGILDCGFRYDARDRKYKVFDVNPRIGSTFRLFVSDTGMDVARAAYLDLTGQSAEAGVGIEGRKWMLEDLDLASAYQYWRDGNLTAAGWLHSVKGVHEYAFLDFGDLRPVASVVLRHARRVFTGGKKRVN